MDADLLRLQLELRRSTEPIEGRLTDEEGETTAFSGWLELIGALEAARASAHPSSPQGAEPPRSRGGRRVVAGDADRPD